MSYILKQQGYEKDYKNSGADWCGYSLQEER